MDTLTIARPDDWHLHVREGALLKSVVPDTAGQFARAIIMPNLTPPVVTVDGLWLIEMRSWPRYHQGQRLSR